MTKDIRFIRESYTQQLQELLHRIRKNQEAARVEINDGTFHQHQEAANMPGMPQNNGHRYRDLRRSDLIGYLPIDAA